MQMLPGAERLMELHDAELPQMDYLCGCFWATLALRMHGICVRQDEVGASAGSSLSNAPDPAAFPPGEDGRRDHQIVLPTLDPEISGTASSGLVRAVSQLSGGRVVAIPIAGPFDDSAIATLLDLLFAVPVPLVVSLNVATREFWGARPTPRQIVHYLETGERIGGPAKDWDVGHLVGLFGLLRGASGALAMIGDTYRSLGSNAVYLQPIECVGAALRREGMTPGGVLVYTSMSAGASLEPTLREYGFRIESWNNGSPDLGPLHAG